MSHSKYSANIEHLNLTIKEPDKVAKQLCQLFDWKVRWAGESMDNGYTVHVGSEQSYIALYEGSQLIENTQRGHTLEHNLNHIGIVVKALAPLRARANDMGLAPFNDRDYGPCQSFYCHLNNGLEIEVICYS